MFVFKTVKSKNVFETVPLNPNREPLDPLSVNAVAQNNYLYAIVHYSNNIMNVELCAWNSGDAVYVQLRRRKNITLTYKSNTTHGTRANVYYFSFCLYRL